MAETPPLVEFNGADIAWMLISSALVLMMTAPGLALFYGGLVRKKNILGVMMQCMFLVGVMSLVWALWGYSLVFRRDLGRDGRQCVRGNSHGGGGRDGQLGEHRMGEARQAEYIGARSGAVAGLVCITPASGSCGPMAGIILGFAAGLVCFYFCTTIKNKFGYDDSLVAFGVHGVGGTLGALLTGVFASKAITGNSAKCGLLEGNGQQLVAQGAGIIAAAAIAVIGTVVILKVVDSILGLRVDQAGELQGLDLNQHGEEGYIFL